MAAPHFGRFFSFPPDAMQIAFHEWRMHFKGVCEMNEKHFSSFAQTAGKHSRPAGSPGRAVA
jgi:hypothetical protein